jgi:hypothetical protein
MQLFAVCIASEFQVRPGVMNVANRQNQVPTLLFKNGTVVPIQQASGQLNNYSIFIICTPKYSESRYTVSDQAHAAENFFLMLTSSGPPL